ncbi:MAG: endolytic transglycosylase MltG [Bacteroidetes bacterium]|nr:endolytic transglycosylase MltG [Bacteroidota bacterium]
MRRKFGAMLCLTLIAGLGITYLLFSPNTSSFDSEKSLYIYPESSLTDVVDSLEYQGLIHQAWTFELLANATGWADQIKAGHYVFSSPKSNLKLLQTLRKGLQSPVSVRIPSGTTRERVAQVASLNMAFEPQDFLKALRDTSLASSLGTDTLHLFGYMLPDTYHFYWLTDAHNVVRRIKREYDSFYERELFMTADTIAMTPDQVLNIAAIVEWETNLESEKSRIAGVYLNRLRRQWPLQADPTVQFALIEIEGKRRRLFYRDYRIKHPYNTYLYQGLPPGPITNPSPTTLKATASAENHDYMFFVASPEGGHSFNSTLRGHNQDVRIWHRYMTRQSRKRASDTP